MENDNPILNNPYEEPKLHYATSQDGSLDYSDIRKGRRIFTPEIQAIPIRQKDQKEIFEVNDLVDEYGDHLINMIRDEVGKWRKEGYTETTRVSRELLNFWFCNSERIATKQLFYAQREAVETAVWLNEVAERSNVGQNILNKIKEAQRINGDAAVNLPRIAFKMATGSGKTVVMAMQILYHFFNRQEYRNDTRFADNFLIITPGITIKDRLGVLYVNPDAHSSESSQDYYRLRHLVPKSMERQLLGLNARIVITHYHALEQKTLQGNKRSPFDGKLNAQGNKTEALESFNQVVKRLLGKFKSDSRLLVLNDEAHHCYMPKEKGKANDDIDSKEENQRAAVWFTGLSEIGKRFKINTIYDLSATPYFLSGSGYAAYSLFPWVVSDFGLIEAIESGLVKIPFLPESDTTQELTMPVLRNLYEHVKKDLPKKGQKTQKKEAKKAGKKIKEERPQLPPLVKGALDQMYSHYEDVFEKKDKSGKQLTLEDTPPVFIIVCNNTSVSREVFKYIAGYEILKDDGSIAEIIPGKFDLFSNFDAKKKQAYKRPPTLLIDSDALENSGQIDEDFKKVFEPEIENFKREYRVRHPEKSVENIDDADILREVVNTVGKPGTLGSHIRCVVSVSMLTEGWDANTVSHIMGLRAFGSQLLCEQVAGRALRRRSYYVGKDGKFQPEYAHIVGVPFKIFKGGVTTIVDPPEFTAIHAIPKRQAEYEITFPNLTGYRIETLDEVIKADFSKLENFEIDGSKEPVQTVMGTAVSALQETLTVEQVLEKRDQEIIYYFTKELLQLYFSDDEKNPRFQKFQQLKNVVSEWYETKVHLIGITDPQYKKMLYFRDPKEICDHIMKAIYAEQRATDRILPVFNFYNKFGSTKYVIGNTSKPVFATKKSHVNYVVADTESWEQIAAKTLEELDEVKSYVKNAFLGFIIPYVGEGKDKQYFPDFIARCKKRDGKMINLIIEVTGMNREKADKKWYVENRWLPAVNAVRDTYGYDEWHFIEIANDIRDIKNQLANKIKNI